MMSNTNHILDEECCDECDAKRIAPLPPKNAIISPQTTNTTESLDKQSFIDEKLGWLTTTASIENKIDTILDNIKFEEIDGKVIETHGAKAALQSLLEQEVLRGRLELVERMITENWQKPIPEQYALDTLKAELNTLLERSKEQTNE
jgi:hypothetical protein